jgi:AP-1 complex subunit gamma-1
MVQLGVWMIGEFGEMLVNGSARDPENNPIVVEESEIMELFEKILEEHTKKGERSDTIICWTLTALSKMTIRLKTISSRVQELLELYSDHMNIEI